MTRSVATDNLTRHHPLAAVLISVSVAVVAADPLIEDLAARLAQTDAATVNAHLSANWETKMRRLGRLVRSCDSAALRLSVSLLDTTNLEAYQGHVFALELAMGKCPRHLLPILPKDHVTAVCALDAFAEIHPAANLVAEIDRRIHQIRVSSKLANSVNGQICLNAYLAARSVQQSVNASSAASS